MEVVVELKTMEIFERWLRRSSLRGAAENGESQKAATKHSPLHSYHNAHHILMWRKIMNEKMMAMHFKMYFQYLLLFQLGDL